MKCFQKNQNCEVRIKKTVKNGENDHQKRFETTNEQSVIIPRVDNPRYISLNLLYSLLQGHIGRKNR